MKSFFIGYSHTENHWYAYCPLGCEFQKGHVDLDKCLTEKDVEEIERIAKEKGQQT